MADESVMVDERSSDLAGDESVNEESQEIDEQAEDQEIDSEAEGGDEEVKLTEKGTKLDPNPQSAVHQELANAKRQIQQMEQVLTNPTLLRRYAEQNGMTLAEAKADLKGEQEEIVDEFTPDQFKTADDIAQTFNRINKTVRELREENARLQEGYSGINSSRKLETIASNMQRDIATVQEKYPELNPKSPEYDSELEREVGSLYQDLDFDQETGSFRGNVSVLTLADRIMSAAKRARKRGSKEAQTDVKVKQSGKVTSGTGKSKDTSSEGLTIAQKIAKAVGN